LELIPELRPEIPGEKDLSGELTGFTFATPDWKEKILWIYVGIY